jgi:6-phosphogluconate dehydrogenase
MELAMVGLGRMGGNMARRLRRHGIEVVAFDRDVRVAQQLAHEIDGRAAESLDQAVALLKPPRVVWLMVPAGEATEQQIEALRPLLTRGDLIVDGGNANFKDSMRRGATLAASGVQFVDAGVSGGVWGLENGYALMVGGDNDAVARLTPVLKALAPTPTDGWLHCGPVGAGHYVKMIHNGIEYGMMQALAEGLALMKSRTEFQIDLAKVTEMWRHGSVVRSWLLDLTAEFLAQDAELTDIAPIVADSGEGRWTAI